MNFVLRGFLLTLKMCPKVIAAVKLCSNRHKLTAGFPSHAHHKCWIINFLRNYLMMPIWFLWDNTISIKTSIFMTKSDVTKAFNPDNKLLWNTDIFSLVWLNETYRMLCFSYAIQALETIVVTIIMNLRKCMKLERSNDSFKKWHFYKTIF